MTACQTKEERNAKRRETDANYRASHRKEKAEANRRFTANNPEKQKIYSARWRAAHPEIEKERQAARRAAKPDERKKYSVTWWARNPEARRIYNHNRRALLKENGGKLSRGIVSKLFILQRGKCVICKKSLKKAGHHLDHIMPLVKGGKNIDSNVQLTCPKCNNKKKDKHPIQFMQEMGYLL